MQKPLFLIGFMSMVYFLLFGLGSPVLALEMDLVGLLTKNLGVTDQQAEGGAGAIFNTASQNMSVEDFAKVTNAMPEVQPLLNSAPTADMGSGTVGGLSSMLNKGGSSLGGLTELAGVFSKLGMGSDMVGKFIPIVLEYAQSKGGSGIANLLKTALQ